jgi:5,10-methylenetetrahydromethanopterin reductase
MVEQFTWTGDQAALRTRVEATIESGVTELLYAPMGQDIPRELRAFAEMAAPFRA